MSKIYPNAEILILFGARGEERIYSDFDIMVLSNQNIIKNKSEFIEGILVSVFQLSKKEFIKRLNEKNKLILNIYSKGKILKGGKKYEKIIW